jgi:hypothetical protein
LSEHDTDIDFDFFEDEPPTQESSRTERLIPRRQPRGPQRPPRGPTNLTPLLRLIGLVAFAILIVVLLVLWVQSCQEASKEKTYKSYMTRSPRSPARRSRSAVPLSQVLLAQGQKQAQLEQRIAGLARQEQLDVQRAQEITPPGTLRDEHNALIQSLQYRVSGLTGLASALAATANVKDAERAGGVLAGQMQRLLASDVIYADSFKDPSAAELRRQGVTGTAENGGPLVPSSNFLQSAELVTPTAMGTVISRIRGGSVTPEPGRPARDEPRLYDGAAGEPGAEHLADQHDHRAHELADRGQGRGLGRLAGGEHPGHAHDPAAGRQHRQAGQDQLHQPG